MSASKVELVGGNFQDSQGNLLVNGYLKMKLSSDEEVNDSLICSGIEITVTLDANGNAVAGQYIWGNDVMSPANSYYIVTAYTAQGQIAWGNNNQQVVGSPTFDLGSWIPNSVISWSPSIQPLSLEVAGTPLSSQTILDFVNSGNVTFTDLGSGQISASATIPTSGIPTPDQARFGLWEALGSPNGSASYVIGTTDDVIQTADSGAANILASNGDATQGPYFQIQIISNLRAYVGLQFLNPLRNCTAEGIFSWHYDTINAAGNFYQGMTDVYSSSPSTGNGICIGIQKVSGVNGNYQLLTSIAGVLTAVDTGVPAVSGTRTKWKIVVNGGVATLFINGTSVATQSNLPTAIMAMVWYSQGNTGIGSTFINFEYQYGTCTTP